MSQGPRKSTRAFMMGTILILAAAGLFLWGANSGVQPMPGQDSGELMARIGQISGALGGVGVVLWIIGLVLRARKG